MYFVGL